MAKNAQPQIVPPQPDLKAQARLTDNNDPQRRTIAAIDLGSNSFHLILAELSHSQEGQTCKIIHREKRKVRLAAGLDPQQQLDNDAITRGVETLTAFGKVLENIAPDDVRVVGTYTFRTAKNINELLAQLKPHFPYPIEILSGPEEARLIYQGVYQDQHIDRRSLVIDIGGGSTELVIGEDQEPLIVHSCAMGCVSLTKRYFADSAIDDASFQQAIIDAEQQLEPLLQSYQRLGWQRVIGTSGSIKTLSLCAAAMGLSDGRLTLDTLNTLRTHLITCGNIEQINLPGVTPDRAPVLCGGLAVLIAAFDLLEIDQLFYGDAALREGLLQDMQARLNHCDIRHQSVANIAARFDISTHHAQRVGLLTQELFDLVQGPWQLTHDDYSQLLNWAAQLHEVGLHINYQSVHRHSAYIIEHAIMAGFNNEQQATLAFILLNHRKSLKTEEQPLYQQYNAKDIWRLIAAFRISVMLSRFRHTDTRNLTFSVSATGLTIQFDKQWQSLQCLLDADLQQEKSNWQNLQLDLDWQLV
ncbi:exopolyphosphatase [Maricurvus nonylphenolicus]|uniref:Ppx/GppA phosphatase family protein n=1 Tax=Maricurvus nonylphenolicus TaxID=1008307 RepID=UPI0036F237B2